MNISKTTARLLAATALVAATAAVPAPETNTLRVRVRLNSAHEDCICPVTSTATVSSPALLRLGTYITEQNASGVWIVIASMTPGAISQRPGQCHKPSTCNEAEIACRATVSVRVAVFAMGSYPGNVFFLEGNPAVPMGPGNVERPQLTSINECGRDTTASTSLFEMDPATGLPSNQAVLTASLHSVCGNCN